MTHAMQLASITVYGRVTIADGAVEFGTDARMFLNRACPCCGSESSRELSRSELDSIQRVHSVARTLARIHDVPVRELLDHMQVLLNERID